MREPVGLDSLKPLTAQEAENLDLLYREITFHPFDVFCGDCPDVTTSSTRSVCCRVPPPPRRSFWRRLFGKESR